MYLLYVGRQGISSKPESTINEIKRILISLQKLSQNPFTGGEPLLHPDIASFVQHHLKSKHSIGTSHKQCHTVEKQSSKLSTLVWMVSILVSIVLMRIIFLPSHAERIKSKMYNVVFKMPCNIPFLSNSIWWLCATSIIKKFWIL